MLLMPDTLTAAKIDAGAVGQASENGQLVGRVHPLHVQGGVGLGKTLGLGLRQGLSVGQVVVGHLGQNIIGGAV